MKRETHTIDATNQSLGRVASQIAILLMGKNKASFQRHIDMGDAVVVNNVAQIVLTGKKGVQKKYYRHTLYPGNLKETQAKDLLQDNPQKLLRDCVMSMLPDNRLRNERMKRLTIT